MKRWCIGDVHGCGAELYQLIKQINPTAQDKIYCLGDLFDTAFNGHEVWHLIHKYNIQCLMGNHEHKMLKYLSNKRSWLPPHYYWTIDRMVFDFKACSHDSLQKFLKDLPLVIPLDDYILCHGGIFLPDPEKPDVSANIYGKPNDWADFYRGKKTVIHGHVTTKDFKPRFHNNTVCIDTAACHGKFLTAFCLDTKEWIQVAAKENYYEKVKEIVKNNDNYNRIDQGGREPSRAS